MIPTLSLAFPWWPARRCAARAAPRGPAGESPFARALRLLADRDRLAEMEPRLRRDIGLPLVQEDTFRRPGDGWR